MSFLGYPEYRNSGVEWLADVPTHWQLIPLWTLFNRTKRTGYADAELLSIYRDYGVIPKSSRDDNFNKSSDDLSSYQLVEPGDLAINKMKAWQGSVAISQYRGIVSPAYHIYSATHKENSRFLHHLFRSMDYISGYLANSKGIRVNQWDLEPQQHSRMPVLLPPLSEQTQIARFLDHETAKIDALIREQERLIKLLHEKRQAVISHAVTKGLDPNVSMKDSGVEWLGDLPTHWRVRKFFFGIKKVLDNRGRSPSYSDTGIPILEAKQLSSESMKCSSNFDKFISHDSYLNFIRDDVFPGDVLMVTVGSIGKVGVVGENPDYVVLQNIVGFRVADDVDSEFMGVYLKSRTAFMAMQATNKESILSSVKVSDFIQHKMPLPPLDEQRLIADSVKNDLAKFESLQQQAESLCCVLVERRSALISAAVTGKIDVRNWQPPVDEGAFDEQVRRTGVEATA